MVGRVLRWLGEELLWFGVVVGVLYVVVSLVVPEHGSLLAIGLGLGLILICGIGLRVLPYDDDSDY